MEASHRSQVTIITLTPEELKNQKLGIQNLALALEALHRDGVVVLGNAVEIAHLDKLNSRMTPEALERHHDPETHRNYGLATGNFQLAPPLDNEYLFTDVLANPWASQIVQCMIGPKPFLRFYSSNAAVRAEGRQPPHIDMEFPFPKIPLGFALDISLVGTSPENGQTEYWLGTHRDTDVSVLDKSLDHREIRQELQDERRKVCPPIQPTLPKGSLAIRDMRLWHAGMPNKTDVPRIMLVSIQSPYWYDGDVKMKLPERVRDAIQWREVVPNAEWIPETDGAGVAAGMDMLREHVKARKERA